MTEVGRPTDYTPEMAERICVWLAGGKSARSFCREFDDAPDISTVMRWIVRHDEFRVQYVQARESAGYAHADRIIEVVENLGDPHSESPIDAHTARAMMDGLKWAAERMAPKSHMPQSLVNHQSPDGSMSPKEPKPIDKDLVDAVVKKLIG